MRALFLGALLSMPAECREKCDYAPAAVEGSYRGSNPDGAGLEDVFVTATQNEVSVTYTRADGTRFRAHYRVREKREQQ